MNEDTNNAFHLVSAIELDDYDAPDVGSLSVDDELAHDGYSNHVNKEASIGHQVQFCGRDPDLVPGKYDEISGKYVTHGDINAILPLEQDDLDFSVPLDFHLLESLRVNEQSDHACPVTSKLSVDHNSQLPDLTVDMPRCTSNILECDVHEMYVSDATPGGFVTRVQSQRDDSPQNLVCDDDVLNFLRSVLLEDDAEEKGGITGNSGESILAPSNLSSMGSHIASSGADDSEADIIEYMHHNCFEDRTQENAPLVESSPVINPGFSPLISEEDLDFSDDVLKYISDILLEEDVEDKSCSFQESEALQVTEKALFEAMWDEYPASKSYNLLGTDQICGVPGTVDGQWANSGRFDTAARISDSNLIGMNLTSHTFSQSPYNSSSSSGAAADSAGESPVSSFELVDTYSQVLWQANKDLKEAKGKESSNELISECNGYSPAGKRHALTEDSEILDGRSSKQVAVHCESSLSDDIYDEILIFRRHELAIREEINKPIKAALHHDQQKGPKGGKKGSKKREAKKNEVDLRTLLTLCAQAVAAEDLRSVTEYLKQIRQHSTPTGDGMQRLAYYFADGLEARMAGAGTQVYKTLVNMPVSGSDILKAYNIYLAASPHRKTSNFFSNETILNVAVDKKCSSLHIVDFGTLYGFQWPSFLHKLSFRSGGPPKVRFTAIDFPCPGFRPSQRIQETGRRLEDYAKKYNIPFEFNGLAQNWETIRLEDIKINKDEALVVNCLFRLRYLLDETVIIDSPRDIVLNLIRKMNPIVFVLGICNGGYNGPFFLTRFREALFHYSSAFDLLDTVIPRDNHERMLLERVVLGRELKNAIACEGRERIERPETYKQWQVRLGRAKLEALTINKDILENAKKKLKSYHKDFVIDTDGCWLLQGWKGRIAYALSSWKPCNNA